MPDNRTDALAFLTRLIELLQKGDLNVLEFYVNPSVVDPCNMSISIKTCRASGDATGIPSVEYATADGKETINRTRLRQLQSAYDREQARKERDAIAAKKKRDEDGVAAPPSLTGFNKKPEVIERDGKVYLSFGSYYTDEDGLKWQPGDGPLFKLFNRRAPPPPTEQKKPTLANGARILDLD